MFFLVGLLLLINIYMYWKALVVFINSVHYYFNYLLNKDTTDSNVLYDKWSKFITLFKINELKNNINNKLTHQKSFNSSLDLIENKNHLLFHSDKLKKYKILLVNTNIDFDIKKIKEFCNKNDIQLYFVGNEKPDDMKEFFSENNIDEEVYISPYHYSKSIFNYVTKNNKGVISDFPNDEVLKDKQFIINDLSSNSGISENLIYYLDENNLKD